MPIRILILEDHQPTIDGYYYRLSSVKGFEIVAAIPHGEQLKPILKEQVIDVLLLDVEAPISEDNRTPYPIFSYIVELREQYPNLKIIIISMHGERTLIESALKAGVNGYILKDDRMAIQNLANVIRTVMKGGSYLGEYVRDRLYKKQSSQIPLTPRQLQILSMCAAYPHLSQEEIGQQLGLEYSTVRNYLSSIYDRLEARNLVEAIAKARALNIISPLSSTYQPNVDDLTDLP